ncbi:hypothetical protein GOP47_0015317 [Adiantum capillus-veneris]|uniref:Myb-like domain-containing protein n=1 Tax=Adiantum capillus-veneris TaxID=13818 RepID=A0A9D4UKE1_ADICA|nr:hypothetical protein GOP47_0015317 [Adiantum capillus-veneris]
MVKTRSGSASCSSPRRPRRSSAALVPRKHKRRRRALAMADKKKKLRRQTALQKQVSILSDERGNGGLKPDPQKHCPPQSCKPTPKTARKTVAKRGIKSESPAAYCGRKTSSKQAVAPINEEFSGRNLKSSGRNRSRQPRDTKVRIFESAEACTTERTCAQLTEAKHGSGWTSEQDAALQSAYFLVRPSSNFWFEVSKKVSGKTAKDCFDRFYSAHPTPPSTPPRSKKILIESPVRTISFASSMPSLNCKGRFGRGKQGLLKARQTVRHILRHQKVADESYEADVFSAVEQLNPRNSLLQNCISRTISPLPALERNDSESPIATPASCSGYAKSGDEVWWSVASKLRSSSNQVQKKDDSRSSMKNPLLSPEVLKAEHNPSRLDRFLNVLHMRRVHKRKSSSLKGMPQSEVCLNSDSRPTLCVAAAREAILMDAKEVLKTSLKQKAGEDQNSRGGCFKHSINLVVV